MNLDEIIETMKESPKLTVLIEDFKPMPAPRPRAGRWGTYMPKNYKTYKESLGEGIERFLAENGLKNKFPIEPWAMYAVFAFPYPKGESKYTISPESFTQADVGDSDNLVKGVMDTLQDIGRLTDDSIIASVLPVKIRVDGAPYIKFTIYDLPKVNSITDQSKRRLWSIICNEKRRKQYQKELMAMSKSLFG